MVIVNDAAPKITSALTMPYTIPGMQMSFDPPALHLTLVIVNRASLLDHALPETRQGCLSVLALHRTNVVHPVHRPSCPKQPASSG
jgi:hypothetical protein